MRTLICILFFFPIFSASAQPSNHSVADLYKHVQRTFTLTNEGKSLEVIALCDSVIRKYKSFPGSGHYLGYTYIYLAKAAMQQGDISLARFSFEQAAGYFKPGSPELAFQIPVNLVALNIEADRTERGLTQGLQLLTRADFRNDPTRHGALLNNLATAASEIKQYKLADSLYSCLFKMIKNKPYGAFDSALTYRNFGLYKLATGSPKPAKNAIQRSLELYQFRYGDSHFQTAKSWHDLGKVFRELNQIDSVGYCFKNARLAFHLNDSIEFSQRFSSFRLDYETVLLEFLLDEIDLQRIIAFQHSGRQRVTELEMALQKSNRTIRRFEGLLRLMISSESGFILADKGRKIFDMGMRLLLDLYRETGDKEFLSKALIWSVQAGSMSLHAKAGVESRSFEDDSTRARVFRLYSLRKLMEKNTDINSRSIYLLEYQSLKEAISSNWTTSIFSSDSEKSRIKQISRAIGKGRFLCYHQLDSILIVFSQTNQRLAISEMPINNKLKSDLGDFAKWIETPISGNYQNESVHQFFKVGASLYETLLQPFVEFGNSKELFIRPDGLLLDLPFEAMIKGNAENKNLGAEIEFRDLPFVQKSFRISYVSSIVPAIKKPIHLFIRPSMRILYCPDDQLAPEINREMEWLSDEMNRTKKVQLRESAFNFKAALANADIIHFSGHVIIDQDDAMQTIMGCSGQSETSFHLSELLYIRLSSDLVFINGCESSKGVVNHGDGNLSPGLFFLLAGARGVIEHRWKAPDLSGAILAREFYKDYPRKNPSIALSNAKRNYLENCQPGLDHPHYWAGMVYTCPIITTRSRPFQIIPIYSLGIGLLLGIGFIIRKRIRKRITGYESTRQS